MPLGVPLPAEAAGTLRAPKQWSRQTAASILMGYEIAVTPLQLVTAYAAIANGGELLEPHIVKEVRSVDGKVVYRARPKAIRRVMSGEVARTIQQMLLAVVQEGTATRADMLTFEVAGKSGTARRTSENAGYTAGNYTASFVVLLPGNDPQYVVLVELDSQKGAHYAGGEIAAMPPRHSTATLTIRPTTWRRALPRRRRARTSLTCRLRPGPPLPEPSSVRRDPFPT
jgi:cell division protein FtsI (penicillin-binding protein 3)